MVLLNDIIEIFTLSDFHSSFIVLIEQFDPSFVNTTPINVDESRLAISTDGCIEKTQSRLGVTLGREQKIDCITLFVDGTIVVYPFTFNLDAGVINLFEPALYLRFSKVFIPRINTLKFTAINSNKCISKEIKLTTDLDFDIQKNGY